MIENLKILLKICLLLGVNVLVAAFFFHLGVIHRTQELIDRSDSKGNAPILIYKEDLLK